MLRLARAYVVERPGNDALYALAEVFGKGAFGSQLAGGVWVQRAAIALFIQRCALREAGSVNFGRAGEKNEGLWGMQAHCFEQVHAGHDIGLPGFQRFCEAGRHMRYSGEVNDMARLYVPDHCGGGIGVVQVAHDVFVRGLGERVRSAALCDDMVAIALQHRGQDATNEAAGSRH